MSAADINNTIALDLGTSNSCCTVWKGDQAVVLNTNDGNTTPSVVYVTDSDMLYGRTALNKKGKPGCFFEFKRILGLGFNDKLTQEYIRRWPFTVKDVKGDNVPCFVVKMGDEEATFTATELYSVFINYFKEKAEEFLEHSITHIVLTVPAHFNDVQRIQVKAAAESCDLTVLRILNEPSAAAFAYGFENQQIEKNILIYDLGGGTFDVSILSVKNGSFEVISCNGDSHLGGDDFDNNLSQYVMEQYKRTIGEDISTNMRWKARIRDACENCKQELSFATTSRIEFEESGFECSISRYLFEDLNSSLFKKTISIVEKTLRDANLTKDAIHEVVLVGGSARIPKIQELLSNCFPHSKVCKSINPDEAVAMGALIMAQKLDKESGGDDNVFRDIDILDCTPLSLGVETVGGVMSVMIPRNTRIPTTYTDIYTTPSDYQSTVEIKVFQGERLLTRDNCLLGKFTISDIPLMKADEPIIEITFYIDENNILNVSAIEKKSQKQSKILIDNANTNLSQQQIDEMIATANAFRKDDEENAKKLEYISELENLVRAIHNELDEKESVIPPEKRRKIEESALSLQDFLYACAGSDTNEILASINNARQLLSVLGDY